MRNYIISIILSAISLYAQAFSFIAIGDTPYSKKEEIRIKKTLLGAIKEYNPPFVTFYGDLKSGGESCTDELLLQRRDMVMEMIPNRVFYTPGDNEWTDCDRTFLDKTYSELERLSFLKKIFFSKPLNLPDSWKYASQANYIENARWMQDGHMFITLHMVSTNNGRVDILKSDIEQALAMVEARDQANRVWMAESFKLALQEDAKSLVIITQADVTAANGAGVCTSTNRMQCDAFAKFKADLKYQAKNFAKRGNKVKPVLLIHGDTNPYCLDKITDNLFRLNAWGDFQNPADATIVTIDSSNKDLPFSAKTLLGNKSPDKGCK
jgi:hypothetical protein